MDYNWYQPYQSMEQRLNAMQSQMQMPQNFNRTAPSYGNPSSQGITWVNGYEGAKAALIPIDVPVLLMDSTDSKFYIKQINNMGVPVIQSYRFYPEEATLNIPATPNPSVATPAEVPVTAAEHNEMLFLKKLEELSNEVAEIKKSMKPERKGASNG